MPSTYWFIMYEVVGFSCVYECVCVGGGSRHPVVDDTKCTKHIHGKHGPVSLKGLTTFYISGNNGQAAANQIPVFTQMHSVYVWGHRSLENRH